jgi:hypothetical protein
MSRERRMADQNADDRTASTPTEDSSAAVTTPGGTIGRFIVEGSLGAGGMGVVLVARDPTLNRRVAIKVLRSGTLPAASATAPALAREAQAMARLQHPNVTTVYEIGTVGEQLFVVMELVDGQTLKSWMRETARSEAELTAMFLAVGRGLEAVHAAGLVHRDFKPDNVLIGHDGRPRVSDFGLVRAPAANAPSVEGEASFTAPAGTPAYMAPEQFAGLASDARSDQFSFCVTLYEAMCGERPFVANAPPDQRRAPVRPPRTWRGSARLFDLVARGLASRSEERWPSLTALLSELGQDRAARRRRILTVSALALLAAILVVGALALRRNAARRVYEAQQLGQTVQQMRSRMHAEQLLPLHDTKPERDRIRVQMKEIEAQMRRLGDEGRGPGELALGVGHFALREYAKARQHLEAAWNAGERGPDLAYELGLVLGETYASAKVHAPPLPTDEQRKAHNRELVRTLRDPAFAYLRQADGATDVSPKFVSALIARWERRFDDALRDADAALREVPSLYQASVITAEIQSEQATAAFNADNKDRGVALMADAEKRFQRAIDVGRSDANSYKMYSDWLMSFSWYQERLGQDSTPTLEHSLALCSQGQQAESDATWPDEMIANSGWMLADSALVHHRDPRPYLRAAVAAAGRAIARDPSSFQAYSNLGGAWLSQANDWDLLHGEDAGSSLEKAIAAYQSALALRADVDALGNLGLANEGLAAWRSAHGGDADAAVEAAMTVFDKARALRPDLHFADTNACDTLVSYARDRFDHGAETNAITERADRYCAAGRAGDPGMPEPFDSSAHLEGLRAQAAARAGADPSATWERAFGYEDKAIAVSPKRALSYAALAELAAHRAEYSLAHGRSARADLARARAAADEAVRLEPGWPDGYRARALVELVRAQGESEHGDPTPAITAGLAATTRALAIKSDDGRSLATAAELRWIEARFEVRRGASPAAAVADGRKLVARSLALDPRAPAALAIRAGLDRLTADRARR